jgi:hypothetical protein
MSAYSRLRRRTLIDPTIVRDHGRIFKRMSEAPSSISQRGRRRAP